MEIISQLQNTLGGLNFAIAVIFLFTAVVFIHEMGHYLIARWCGVGIEAFSIGFGPEIFAWNDKAGTRWRVAWIPLGGYVKFIDDADPASATGKADVSGLSDEQQALMFRTKPLWQRAAIVAAGPIANFLLAIVIFASLFAAIGEAQTRPRVDAVLAGGAAEAAGFEVGDVVLAIDGVEIKRFQDFRKVVALNPEKQMSFLVDRGGSQLTIEAAPKANVVERYGKPVTEGLLGIQYRATAEEQVFREVGMVEALGMGVSKTWELIRDTFAFLARFLTFSSSGGAVGGLVTITQAAGEAAELGLTAYVTFIALISISLGVVNLLPIPVLDGGHLMFYAVEAFRGQPLDERTQEVAFRFGLAVILMIMIAVNGPEVYHLVRGWLAL